MTHQREAKRKKWKVNTWREMDFGLIKEAMFTKVDSFEILEKNIDGSNEPMS